MLEDISYLVLDRDIISLTKGVNLKFQTLRCLKTKIEAKKTTQGNRMIIDLYKIYFEILCVCVLVAGGR